MRRLTGVLAVFLLALAGRAAAQDSSFESLNSLDSAQLLRKARAAAAGKVPEPNGTPAPASGMPGNGHNSNFHASQYNIWSVNCHTEANYFAALATARGITAGILVCQGNPETQPDSHTANWAIETTGETCTYNWGRRCCWKASASPPDITSGPGLGCAREACGGQYLPNETRAMPAGQLVESPGPHVCAVGAAGGPLTLLPGMAITALSERVRTKATTVRVPSYPSLPDGAVLTFTPDRLDSCLDCCKARGDMWSGRPEASVTATLAAGRENQFRRLCLNTCQNSFASTGIPPSP